MACRWDDLECRRYFEQRHPASAERMLGSQQAVIQAVVFGQMLVPYQPTQKSLSRASHDQKSAFCLHGKYLPIARWGSRHATIRRRIRR